MQVELMVDNTTKVRFESPWTDDAAAIAELSKQSFCGQELVELAKSRSLTPNEMAWVKYYLFILEEDSAESN